MLDDVLSAVDHHTEVKLIEALYQRAPRCTTLIVSHRMSVLQEADRVLVFNDGALVEEGSPQALSERDGLYARAWRAQRDYELQTADEERSNCARAGSKTQRGGSNMSGQGSEISPQERGARYSISAMSRLLWPLLISPRLAHAHRDRDPARDGRTDA